jgi:hypothetical protein
MEASTIENMGAAAKKQESCLFFISFLIVLTLESILSCLSVASINNSK